MELQKCVMSQSFIIGLVDEVVGRGLYTAAAALTSELSPPLVRDK